MDAHIHIYKRAPNEIVYQYEKDPEKIYGTDPLT